MRITKKYINSGAPIRAFLETSKFDIEYFMTVYELTEEEADKFYTKQ